MLLEMSTILFPHHSITRPHSSRGRVPAAVLSSSVNFLPRTSHAGLRSGTAAGLLRPEVSYPDGFGTALTPLYPQVINRSSVACRSAAKSAFESFSLSAKAVKAMELAQREAKLFGQEEVGTEHLLLGLIAEEEDRESAYEMGFFSSYGVTLDRARDAVYSLHGQNQPSSNELDWKLIPFSRESMSVLEAAKEQCKEVWHTDITPRDISQALLSTEDDGAKILIILGLLKKQDLQAQPDLVKASLAEITAEMGGVRALKKFCVDLTVRAIDGKIDPVIGRDKEVQRVVEILSRRRKSSAILLGEPGVGKTAVAEGLAIRIASGNVPDYLKGKRIMSLDMGLFLAGTDRRGDLESRVKSLIAEIQQIGYVILLIDEIHTLVGKTGHGDIANLLKPALARGDIQCVGATTLDEYRKYIEKDKALARRFQPVLVNEPSQEDAVKILVGLRDRYEEYHKCRITPEAIHAAVYLSARYIADRYLPDKAIDLIDEAGSRARMDAFKRKKEEQVSILYKSPSEYWQAIRAVQAAQQAALVPERTPDELEFVIDSEGNCTYIGAESVPLSTCHEQELSVIVGPSEIAAVASMWSGIPVQALTSDEQMKLINLEKLLQTRVVGQDDAVSAISRAVRRARVGLKDPNRPIAAMLFCGPTGVGKTELAKALAQHFFGAENAMIRLDMSEYMESHSVSKLVGSPPGYVGYGDGGTLTDTVRKRPYTVILLDEIEKAHQSIFNILLQIFEDGRLTDAQGRVVSFKDTLLVMTSNIGSSSIARGGRSRIGFMFSEGGDEGHTVVKDLVMDELKSFFRPELLNRLDEVVVFKALERSQVRVIVDMMLAETKERLASRGINLEVSEATVRLVCEEGYDEAYGARPLRRAVTRIVEDPVSEALLSSEYKEGDTALVALDDENMPVVVKHSKSNRCSLDLRLPLISVNVA